MSAALENAYMLVKLLEKEHKNYFESLKKATEVIQKLRPELTKSTIARAFRMAEQQGWVAKEKKAGWAKGAPLRLTGYIPETMPKVRPLRKKIKKTKESKTPEIPLSKVETINTKKTITEKPKEFGFLKFAETFALRMEEILRKHEEKIIEQELEILELKEKITELENIKPAITSSQEIFNRITLIEQEINAGTSKLMQTLDTLKGKEQK